MQRSIRRNKIMKTKMQKFCAILLALATLCLISGCTAPMGGGGSLRLKQTRDDMDSAMTRYRNVALPSGNVTLAGQQQVTAAYDAYKAAFDAAVQNANSNYNAPTPNNVTQLADQLLSVLGAVE
jgi:hypothetical protein